MTVMRIGTVLLNCLLISIFPLEAYAQSDVIVDGASSTQHSFVSGLGTCLDVQGEQDDNFLVSNDCATGKESQLWNKDEPYQHSSGKCIDVKNGTRRVILVECREDEDPHWVFRDEIFFHLGTSECMDVTRSSMVDGTNIVIWPCTGNKNQSWMAVPYDLEDYTPKSTLRAGEALLTGQYMEQLGFLGSYQLTMQANCDLVFQGPEKNIIWNSETSGQGKNCKAVIVEKDFETQLNIENGTGKVLWTLPFQQKGLNKTILKFDTAAEVLIFSDGSSNPESFTYNLSHFGTKRIPYLDLVGTQSLKFKCATEDITEDGDVSAITVSWYLPVGPRNGNLLGTVRQDVSNTCKGDILDFVLKEAENSDTVTITVEGSARLILDDMKAYKENIQVRESRWTAGRTYCLDADPEAEGEYPNPEDEYTGPIADLPGGVVSCRASLSLQYR